MTHEDTRAVKNTRFWWQRADLSLSPPLGPGDPVTLGATVNVALRLSRTSRDASDTNDSWPRAMALLITQLPCNQLILWAFLLAPVFFLSDKLAALNDHICELRKQRVLISIFSRIHHPTITGSLRSCVQGTCKALSELKQEGGNQHRLNQFLIYSSSQASEPPRAHQEVLEMLLIADSSYPPSSGPHSPLTHTPCVCLHECGPGSLDRC